MAKISDEIREWCADLDSDDILCTTATLYTLADRIDRELVELPKSADGKIWTGRESCFWTGAEQEGYHQFDSLTLRNGTWFVEDILNTTYTAESVSYERPDSFELIANEMDEFVDDTPGIDTFYASTASRLRDFAYRIRKLAKEQGNE